jgi:hypothetical protein
LTSGANRCRHDPEHGVEVSIIHHGGQILKAHGLKLMTCCPLSAYHLTICGFLCGKAVSRQPGRVVDPVSGSFMVVIAELLAFPTRAM